jgi:hypothetical protein
MNISTRRGACFLLAGSLVIVQTAFAQVPARNAENWHNAAHPPARSTVTHKEQSAGLAPRAARAARETQVLERDGNVLLQQVPPRTAPPVTEPK